MPRYKVNTFYRYLRKRPIGVMLTISEIWHGRTPRQIALRLHTTEQLVEKLFYFVMREFQQVFWIRMGSTKIYMNYDVLPKQYRQRFKTSVYTALFPLGNYGDARDYTGKIPAWVDCGDYIKDDGWQDYIKRDNDWVKGDGEESPGNTSIPPRQTQ